MERFMNTIKRYENNDMETCCQSNIDQSFIDFFDENISIDCNADNDFNEPSTSKPIQIDKIEVDSPINENDVKLTPKVSTTPKKYITTSITPSRRKTRSQLLKELDKVKLPSSTSESEQVDHFFNRKKKVLTSLRMEQKKLMPMVMDVLMTTYQAQVEDVHGEIENSHASMGYIELDDVKETWKPPRCRSRSRHSVSTQSHSSAPQTPQKNRKPVGLTRKELLKSTPSNPLQAMPRNREVNSRRHHNHTTIASRLQAAIKSLNNSMKNNHGDLDKIEDVGILTGIGLERILVHSEMPAISLRYIDEASFTYEIHHHLKRLGIKETFMTQSYAW